MALKNGVVAHFQDGRVEKGVTHDFSPNRSSFHLATVDGASRPSSRSINSRDLKALFFVKDLEGDPLRVDLRGFIGAPAENTHGKKIAVRFHDAELFCGYSLGYTPQRDGFFMFPADPNGNNLRVFVVTASASEICEGPAAEELARRILHSEAA